MWARKAAGAALLAFAGSSLVGLAVREYRGLRASAGGAEPDGLVVYLCREQKRCDTCETMEAYTRGILPELAAAARPAGTLTFRSINFQEPGNERFRTRFALYTVTIVLAEYRGGALARWRSLDKAWGFLAHGKEDFQKYLLEETRAFASGRPDAVPAPGAAGEGPAWRLLLVAVLSVFGLGLLTSLSPCALAGNVAAVSFLAQRASSLRRVLLAGLLYTLGAMAAYAGLAALLVGGLLALPGAAQFFGRYVNAFVGPALVAAGVLLLGLLEFTWSGPLRGEALQERAREGRWWTAPALGFLLALAFCPTTAALYFGGLVPLALKHDSPLALPVSYALGAGLPVMCFAFLIAAASQALGRWFKRSGEAAHWLRLAAGAIFVVVGAVYCLTYGFGVWG